MRIRRRQGAGIAGALLRAALLFGSLGAVLVRAMTAGSPDRSAGVVALDDMATGSIAPAEVLPSERGLLLSPEGRPCLRLPDGSQRGNC